VIDELPNMAYLGEESVNKSVSNLLKKFGLGDRSLARLRNRKNG
jgi:hypothetical protein